ncbi:hypothetical protein MMC07_002567 [Pseudocyphellaria aurata]|nr:hypothetical protein [Pseudocyphellaria aurata]
MIGNEQTPCSFPSLLLLCDQLRSRVDRPNRIRAIAAADSRGCCAAGGGDAVAIAGRVLDVIEGQNSRAGVVAALIDEMDRYASAGAAAMLKHTVGERANLPQGEGRTLREEADSTFVDGAAETEGARHAFAPGPSADGYGLVGANANDVIATVVDGRVVLGRSLDCVSEDLYDRFRVVV